MKEDGGAGGSEAAGALEAGTRLGDYEIRRLIGLGSMSAIYEGVRPDTGKRVAIKVLSPKRAGLPAARARFLREAKLMARVRHPHIVDMIEVGEDGERIYLAMEMLEGEDLGRLLEHSSFLSAAQTADILVPVCEAVAAAHESGIVHRDLKPSNIFLAIRDQKTHPVVLDFGIADDEVSVRPDAGGIEDDGAAPHARLVLGTPYYLSPEQIVDHRAASPSSDQWALGVILYECLTGARPYDGDSLDDVFGAIGNGNAVSPRERRSDISPQLEQIVMRAMSSDPEARFSSVTELAQALRPFRSEVGETRSPSRRRAPSSPAIEAEALQRSPFVRTLTPEADVLDGLWFEPDPAEETSGDTAFPRADFSSEEPSDADVERQVSSEAWPTFVSRWTERWRSVPVRWVGAAAGSALGGLVLLFVSTHGGSAHRRGSPGTATAKVLPNEPGAGRSAVPAVGQAIAASPVADSRAASEKLAVTAPPASEKVLTVAGRPPSEPAMVEEPPVKEPVVVKERPAKVPVAEPPVTPAAIRSSGAERRVRTARISTEAPPATGPGLQGPSEKPRVRANPEVRMHNGVPLLD